MQPIPQPIHLNEISENVFLLHQALNALGYPVALHEQLKQEAGGSTVEQVRALQKDIMIVANEQFTADEPTVEAINKLLKNRKLITDDCKFKVSGQVVNESGMPVPLQALAAYDVDLRGAAIYRTVEDYQQVQQGPGFELLKSISADKHGNYSFTFTCEQYQRAERKKADIIVFALSDDQIVGRSSLVHADKYTDTGEIRQVDVVVKRSIVTSTFYALLMNKLSPFLEQSEVSLIQLAASDDQVQFVAQELDEPLNSIQLAVQAEKLREADSKLIHELLFGIGSHGFPLSWSGIFSKKRKAIEAAIKEAISQNTIRKFSRNEIVDFLDRLHKAALDISLSGEPDGQEATLDTALSIALPDKEQRQQLMEAFRDFEGNYEKFWSEELPNKSAFRNKPELIDSLELSSQLALLGGNHLPLIEELQKKRRVKSVTDLLQLKDEEWKSVIQSSGVPDYVPGTTKEEKESQYIKGIQNQLNATYPTQKISLMLSANELPTIKRNIGRSLNSFFANSKFDFAESSVMDYEPELRQAAGEDFEQVKSDLLTLQRVYQVSPSPEVMGVLLKEGLNSAHAMAAIPEKVFLKSYAAKLGGVENAYATHQKAVFIAERANINFLQLNAWKNGVVPKMVMDKKEQDEAIEVIEKVIPNYSELIGRPDMCECEHCRSVYSPAAYFVELLRFLHFSGKNEVDKTPLEIFFQRRPDLKHLPLTCENTNTLIPYIDLVNEILEYYVAYTHNEDESINPEPLANYKGYDTGEATSEELRASPQHTFQEKDENFKWPYERLKEAIYPFTLPYHRPLDVIRTYLNHLGTSRFEVAAALQTDAEETPNRRLEAELLEFSEEEYKILTQEDFSDRDDEREDFEFYGLARNSELEQLASVPEFLRRTGVKYTDLVEIIKTRFTNSHQWTLLVLEEIISGSEISPESLYEQLNSIMDGANPEADLLKVVREKNIRPEDFTTWVRNNLDGFKSVITLYEPESKCELETTSLKILRNVYEGTSGSGLTQSVWSKLHRFIRLWRKLGWTIQELDSVLYALGEADIRPETISKLSRIYTLQKELKLSLEQLMVFWGAIETYGDKPLYKKLFLNKSAVHLVDLFKSDHLGNYLNAEGIIPLKDQVPAILASFRITEEELQAILDTAEIVAGEDGNKRKLTREDALSLPVVSVIYRHVVLAKALSYKIVDLCHLIRLFGATPFSVLDITGTTPDFTDIDPGKTYEFTTLLASVKSSGFKPDTLKYILTGVLPAESTLTLEPEKILQTVKNIRSVLEQIELAYPDTPLTPLTPELLRNTLIMTFQPEVVDQLLKILHEPFVYSALAAPGLTLRIPRALSGKFSYDRTSGMLTCKGLMSDNEKKIFVDELDDHPQKKDFVNAISQIYQEQQSTLKNIISYSTIVPANPEVSIPEDLAPKYSYVRGRLTGMGIMTETERDALSDGHNAEFREGLESIYEAPELFLSNNFSKVFNFNEDSNTFPLLLNRPENDTPASLDEKLLFVYRQYIPFLKQKLKEDAIVHHIASLIGLSEVATSVLVKEKVEEIIDTVQEKGFSAQYFNNVNFSGRSVEARTEKANHFHWNDIEVTVLPDRFSVRWEVYLAAPASEAYFFVIEVYDAGDAFKVFLDDKLILEKAEGNEVLLWETEEPLNLNSSDLHHLKIECVTSKSSSVQLRWKTATLALEPIPDAFTYPFLKVREFTKSVRIYHRAARFITGFALTEREVHHIKQHAIDFTDNTDQIDFENITTEDWQRVYQIKELSKAILRSENSLIDIFEEAKKDFPEESGSEAADRITTTIQKATGWDKRHTLLLIDHFGYNHSLANVKNAFRNDIALRRLQPVMQLIRKTGTSPELLINFADLNSDFEVLTTIAKNIQSTVQAKYEESEWLTIAGDLNDKIRDHQRNALVAYLLVQPQVQQAGAIDADSLFAYFLIDVQMGTCMDTSRLVQANNSVQLFVSRCLLNLESKIEGNILIGISPDAIDTNRWEWMKNYRVWEANRKVFVYPENWLEPEWRDDRTEFFKELESELLQNDITDRAVESALRAYLNKLHEVASLDLCGMYQDKDTSIIHVFGRTRNIPYKYYYRTYSGDLNKWIAWEKVDLDIRGVEEGDFKGVHLIPIVWKKRIILFWPEFEPKQSPQPLPSEPISENVNDQTMPSLRPNEHWEIKLAFSEYVDGKWTPKQLSSQNISCSYEGKRPAIFLFDIKTEVQDDTEPLTIELCWSNQRVGRFILADIQSNIIAEPTTGAMSYHRNEMHQFMKVTFFSFDSSFSHARSKYFLNNLSHFLYSNQVNDFQSNLRYPYFNLDENRSYFVLPQDIVLRRQVKKQRDYLPAIIEVFSKTFKINFNKYDFIDAIRPTQKKYTRPIPKKVQSQLASTILRDMQSSVNISASFEPIIVIHPGQLSVSHPGFLFHTFYHPFSDEFIKNLNESGIEGLMKSDTIIPHDDGKTFINNYRPADDLVIIPDDFEKKTYYKEDVSFDLSAAYSIYNWELFFHAPLFIATQLSKNGKYAEAMRWFHYIFDPTTDEKPVSEKEKQRYWKFLPFKTVEPENVEGWFRKLKPATDADYKESSEIAEWRKSPFNPHLIARNRPLAYMSNVIIKYVENLIAWGDQLFRRDTMESINQATQLYVMANHILGPRPEFIPKRGKIKAETYASLESKLDDFSNALVQMENLFPYSSDIPASSVPYAGGITGAGPQLYFCIPANEKLITYWDTVADRLFKIRHCMNIEGVERRMALFEPPIDPAMLVKARAQGLDLGSILGNINSPAPLYRFNYLLQKARQFCSEVKSLGAALLSAMEKRDGEELGRMRAFHETGMLDLMTSIKDKQIQEAKANYESLHKTRISTVFRRDHYIALLGIEASPIPDVVTDYKTLPAEITIPLIEVDVDVSLVESDESGVNLIPRENEELNKLNQANNVRVIINSIHSAANIAYLAPDVGIAATPYGVGAKVTYGGSTVGKALTAVANGFEIAATQLNFDANMSAKMASYIRREQDWVLQANLAGKEIIQIDKQITAAAIRVQIAEKDLENHRQQIKNAEEVEQYLKDKFTSQELYQWMKEQLYTVYKQSYNMAYEMAKKTEIAFSHETGVANPAYIQYGYWDNSKEGLLSGEKLSLSLMQLEKAYMEENKRELELSKHISLSQIDPLALLQLKENGKCFVSLPEELFDLDYQGHFFRRIKSVSLTIPCIAGPYANISCTLRLIKNSVRINSILSHSGDYEREMEEGVMVDDPRFKTVNVPVKSIATSRGQNDSGMFEFNFRDERYLPFEGAGAISEWQLELSTAKELRQFDYATISDVIMHLNYTAREAGGPFKDKATEYLKNYITTAAEESGLPLMRMFSMKHDFPNEWHQFLNPAPASTAHTLSFTVNKKRFPFFAQNGRLAISKVVVLVKDAPSDANALILSQASGIEGGEIISKFNLNIDPNLGGLKKGTIDNDDIAGLDVDKPMSIQIGSISNVSDGEEFISINEGIEEVFLVIFYSIASSQ